MLLCPSEAGCKHYTYTLIVLPVAGIIKELRKRNIYVYLIRMMLSYPENRYFFMKGKVMMMSCGVPQRSTLEPFIWNIYYYGVFGLRLPEVVEVVRNAYESEVILCELFS